MTKVFEVVIAVFLITAGLYAALGAWRRSVAPVWKGSRQSVPPLSCIGFAVFFISLGLSFLIRLFANTIPSLLALALVATAISGWILIPVGAALDQRARFRSSYRFQHERRIGAAPGEGFAWLSVAFGVLFLVIILWMVLSHK